MEELIKQATLMLAVGVDLIAALIISLAGLQAAFRAVVAFFRHDLSAAIIRLQLGRWLSLALEFLLASDILRTAVAPTWDDIGKLTAIIVLRTMLNYFLQREVEHEEKRRQELAHAPANG